MEFADERNIWTAHGVAVQPDRPRMGRLLFRLLYVRCAASPFPDPILAFFFCPGTSLRADTEIFRAIAAIVVNVSSSFTSFELMPPFYRYGYAFPFFNSVSQYLKCIRSLSGYLAESASRHVKILDWVDGMDLRCPPAR